MAQTAQNLSQNDSVPSREYFRTSPDSSRVSVMTRTIGNKVYRLNFLHAGHSSWSSTDPGKGIRGNRGHSHPVYHLVLFTGDGNVMIHDGERLPFGRGTLVLTDPGTVHEYRPQDPGGGSFIELTFELRHGDETLTHSYRELMGYWLGRDFPESSAPRTVPPPRFDEMESRLEQIIGLLRDRDPWSEAEASLSLGRLFVLIARVLSGTDLPRGAVGGLEAARRYLETRFAGPVTVAELAGIACLSEGALIRGFTRRYGRSPMALCRSLRITAARHLLAVTGRSIGEIAERVGYGDIYAFSRAFKRETGMTATAWRRSAHSVEKEDLGITSSREKSYP